MPRRILAALLTAVLIVTAPGLPCYEALAQSRVVVKTPIGTVGPGGVLPSIVATPGLLNIGVPTTSPGAPAPLAIAVPVAAVANPAGAGVRGTGLVAASRGPSTIEGLQRTAMTGLSVPSKQEFALRVLFHGEAARGDDTSPPALAINSFARRFSELQPVSPKAGTQIRANQTQIIATLGPATNSPKKISELYEAGVDTFRLNFSHGTHDEHAKSVAMIRALEKDVGAPIGILADLQGPKLRIGAFKDNMKVPLKPGQKIRFDLDPTPGDETRVAFPHPEIMAALEPGAQFLMDDGNTAMKIAAKGDGYVVAEVVYGTELSGKKGVNVPDLSRPVEALTDKDKIDLEFALGLGVDWIAQSFVQTGDDIRAAKKMIAGRAKLIAKMEKPAAIANMKEIIAEADAIMVARGDLGVEIPQEKVPGTQYVLIAEAITAGKPVIVATQMFDSMIQNSRPTRAEVSDVALAVLQGASAVMLSGETSVGKYPGLAVNIMDKMVYEAENGALHSRATLKNPPLAPPFVARPSLKAPSAAVSAAAPAAAPTPETVRARAKAGMRLNAVALWGLAAAGLAGTGAFFAALGLPFAAGVAAPIAFLAPYAAFVRREAFRDGRLPSSIRAIGREALARGGRLADAQRDGAVLAEVAVLAAAAGVPMPAVVVMPGDFPTSAKIEGLVGRSETVLMVHPALGRHPQMSAVLAHEIQHAKDMPHAALALPNAAVAGLALGALAAGVNVILHAVGLPAFDPPGFVSAATAVVLSVPAVMAARLAQVFLLELRADLGSVALTADAAGLERALGLQKRLWTRLVGLRAVLGLAGRMSLKFPTQIKSHFAPLDLDLDGANITPIVAGGGVSLPTGGNTPVSTTAPSGGGRRPPPPAAPAPADQDPAYYQQTPEWAERLGTDASSSSTPEERARFRAELDGLRPLARWMAHFYTRVKQDGIQKAPNILTLEDLLKWVSFVKKFEAAPGWKLDNSPEPMTDKAGRVLKDKDDKPLMVGSIVLEGAKAMFHRTLPSQPVSLDAGDPTVTRDLQRELEIVLNEATSVYGKLAVPKHLSPVAPKTPVLPDAPAAPYQAELLDDQPRLFEAKSVEGGGSMDYIITETVKNRLNDLMMLYSLDHKEKFWPLLVGDTGEGKSSLVKYMFTLPALRAKLGRSVPVVSLSVKEAMTHRELLGGKSVRGIEMGFFSLAAMNGWVLVLEELDQASGEFLKSLNDVLHQIRKQGYFEFEVGGKTVRVKAHPHFWVVGTENGSEGNFSMSRNPHSPDFVKRWTMRYYNRFPPAEQAEIMRGLAVKWYGSDFADRHKLSLDYFEKLVTQFHEPLRRMATSGRLGGDLQEPYEFNRRTLRRFLERWLHDVYLYEASGRKADAAARNLLMARELMEAYGSELRVSGEKEALWDHMNIVFELESKHKVGRVDDVSKGLTGIQIDVRGFFRKGGKLIVDERLVPIEFTARENGGERVPGPEHRLTLVPSLAANVYRNLRNRQFHQHQFSTGPTGTAKTSEQYFVNHMLSEPLFAMTLNEQTPMSDLHGGFLKDPATGEFEFVPGILARAMMYDPEGLLQAKTKLSPSEVRKLARIGATFLVNEGNASPMLESINPALDDGILNLSDGQHSAVAGAGFHVTVTMNPVGEGYVGYPLTPALKSRAQTVEHAGDMSEEELTEIILDQFTGIVRHQTFAEGAK